MIRDWRSAYIDMAVHGPDSPGTSLLYWLLSPVSLLYGLIMQLRAGLYQGGLKKSFRARVPVLSVGNLTLGGTGKTPMVDFLVKFATARGLSCAVVSRGYAGSFREGVGKVSDVAGHLQMSPEECGDEPYLLAIRNPGTAIYVARQRWLGVQAAEREGAQLILLDDGFQHLAVQRDADIVLLDANRPFGNGRLLPAGILREPRTALQRADLVVMTRCDRDRRKSWRPGIPVIYSRHRTDARLKSLDGTIADSSSYAGKSCLAFAGIARPQGFFESLHSFGFKAIEELPLADHQQYDQETLNRLFGSCHNHDLLVTTEKDAVKLSKVSFPKPCLQLGVEMEFDDLTPLAMIFDQILDKYR